MVFVPLNIFFLVLFLYLFVSVHERFFPNVLWFLVAHVDLKAEHSKKNWELTAFGWGLLTVSLPVGCFRQVILLGNLLGCSHKSPGKTSNILPQGFNLRYQHHFGSQFREESYRCQHLQCQVLLISLFSVQYYTLSCASCPCLEILFSSSAENKPWSRSRAGEGPNASSRDWGWVMGKKGSVKLLL